MTTATTERKLIAIHRADTATSLQSLLEAVEQLGLAAEISRDADDSFPNPETEARLAAGQELPNYAPAWTMKVFASPVPIDITH